MEKKSRLNECIEFLNIVEKYLKSNNVKGWINLFFTYDEIAIFAQKRWYERYISENAPVKQDVRINKAETIDSMTISAEIEIMFEYNDYLPKHEIYKYEISWVKELEQCKIIWIERIKKPFLVSSKVELDSMELEVPKDIEIESLWDANKILEYICKSKEKLPSKIYARSITRNIRARESHPFLEGASLLANMMSIRVIYLAKKIYSDNRLQLLANLHNSLGNKMLVRLVRSDRDNSWTSKYVVPWYGYDELYQSKNIEGVIEGSCQMIMAIYYSILRLCGVPCSEIYLIRVEDHEAIIVNDNNKRYLVNPDEIVELTERFLYHSKNISKIYNEKWILTTDAISNMSSEQAKFIERIVGQSSFEYPQYKNANLDMYIDDRDELPSIKELSICEYSNQIKEYVFRNSIEYPDSSYTWAQYAYQTIYVSKPETYLVWSLQNSVVKQTIKGIDSFADIITLLNGYSDDSIFLEEDRIMTSDQVIHYRCGGAKDKTILLYSWFALKMKVTCAICITMDAAYFVFEEDNIVYFYDLRLGTKSKEVDNIIVALDYRQSWFYGQKKVINTDTIVWKKIKQLYER